MIPRPVWVYGHGGHGTDLKAIIDDGNRWVFAGWIDDDPALGHPLPPKHGWVALGVNWPHARRDLLNRLELTWDLSILVHPTAHVDESARLAPGVVIGAHSYVGPGCTLGLDAHVGYGVTMTRTQIGDGSTICPGATICGDVELGEMVLIGAGAVVSNLLRVGSEAKVGAGVVIKYNVPEGATIT